jgi:Na+(H+)/acetate symporter ActP
VPMQFLVLFTGILVFVFFQFNHPPVHFNTANVKNLQGTAYEAPYKELTEAYGVLNDQKEQEVRGMISALRAEDETALEQAQNRYQNLYNQESQVREQVKELITQQNPAAKTQDTDYVFITFITTYLPIGLVGLLLAVIFSAAMSSTSSELNALATTTVIDIYRRSLAPDKSDKHYLRASKLFTIAWGATALLFALIANLFDNLIEAVNIIGSLFYGVILGIFIVAFFMKKIKGNAVFLAAIVSEIIVITIFTLDSYEYISIAYLWLNLIGCILVMIISSLFNLILRDKSTA